VKRQIYLVSESPRRKELLSRLLNCRFFSLKNYHDEKMENGKSPFSQLKTNCIGKINSVKQKPANSLLISSDTIVVVGDQVLGKPGSRSSAVKTLKKISGRAVSVISGVAVFDTKKKRLFYGHEKTVVKIKELSDREIRKYVGTGEPLDKAGAFAIQGKGSFLVEWIEGDYFNVVGLPVQRLALLLSAAGVKI